MDLRFLESFLSVVEYGSMAEAARRLNLTPAAMAQRVRALEAELGYDLMSRVGRTVRPTADGLAILPQARQLLEDARELRTRPAGSEPVGTLRLGATATMLTGFFPHIVASLRQRYPGIDCFVRPGSSMDLYRAAIAGELNAVLIVKPPFALPKTVEWLQLMEEQLVLVAPRKAPSVQPHQLLLEHPFIRYDRSQWGGQIVERYLTRHRLAVRDWLELDALDAILALVDHGLGTAIVPQWAPPWPAGLKIRKIPLPDAETRKVGVLWNRSGDQIAAIRAFVEICTECARG